MGTLECGQAEAVTKTGSNFIIIKDNMFSFKHGNGQQFLQAATIHDVILMEPSENAHLFAYVYVCIQYYL